MKSILVTGGAGFVGSHLVDELLDHDYDVRVLDALVGQVHGGAERPPYLSRDAELHAGDVRDAADRKAVNIGSGESVTVTEIARKLADVLEVAIEPEVTGKFRAGDIRHCFADITPAHELLAYRPAIALEEGLAELAGWLETQTADDRVDDATAELVARGLAR